MRERAPSAQPVIAALLPNHRLIFESNQPPGTPEAFFANLRAADGVAAPGALYAIDSSELMLLDAYEDVGRGVYERIVVSVVRADGRRDDTIVYRMPVQGRRARLGLPSRVQLAQIRAGYADWGLDLRVLDAALDSASAKIA